MIKFFRHIRKSLLMENKTTKYFKYAIGEILLVMVGILLALQVNTWNEARKSANAEAQALVELLEEFKINFKDLRRVERIKTNAENGMRNYLDFLNNDSIPENEKNYVYSKTAGNTWNMTYSVLDGLINSGAINNIKNDSLRTLLNNWESVKQNYMEWQSDYSQTRIPNYYDYLDDKIPSHIIPQDSTYKNYGRFYYESDEELEQFSTQIVHDMKYQNLLKRALRSLYLQLNGIQLLKEDHNKIVNFLEEEIKNND